MLLHRSCAAWVWPRPEMSSSSPSMVSRALCLIAAGVTRSPATSHSPRGSRNRSEEHTSELQSLMRLPYAVFCLKKKKTHRKTKKQQIEKKTSETMDRNKKSTKQKYDYI